MFHLLEYVMFYDLTLSLIPDPFSTQENLADWSVVVVEIAAAVEFLPCSVFSWIY